MIYLKSAEPCFVAHFDMLGAKTAIRRDPQVVWGALCELFEQRERVLRFRVTMSTTGQVIEDRVKYFAFSDTVVLYTAGQSDEDLYGIVLLSRALFSSALRHRVPVRVGMADGQFIADEAMRIFTGPALVDAYELGESAQWLGICMSGRMAERTAQLTFGGGRHPVAVKWSVPLRDGGSESRFVVDWTPEFIATLGVAEVATAEETFAQFSYLFGSWETMPRSTREKYENTVKFFNSRAAEHRGSVSGAPRREA